VLTDEDIYILTLEAKIQEKSDWFKIEEAMKNIKIGEIEKEYSLPIEFDETIDEAPRKILSSKYYSISISPKSIGIRSRLTKTFEMPSKEEKKIKTREVLQDMQSNFNLLLGVFLGARPKTINEIELNWAIRFEFPWKEHLVQNTTKVSFLEKLKEYDKTSNFIVTQIMIVQELPEDKKFSYEILEDLETNVNYIEIKKKFKSSPTTIELVKLVDDSIKIADEIINLVRG
jgi:hypothetical protein